MKRKNRKQTEGTKSLLETASEELKIPLDIVKKVYPSQFEFVAKKIREGGLETIMLPYIGKFQVKKRSLKRVTYSHSNKILKQNTKRPK